MSRPDPPSPRIGITMNLVDGQCTIREAYLAHVVAQGGVPLPLSPLTPSASIPRLLDGLDAVILTGGSDPDTTEFGVPTDPRARVMDPRRQAFEIGLLRHLTSTESRLPVLGICLGMQLLGLVCGGRLQQHLPDVLDSAETHRDGARHAVSGPRYRGSVHSDHVQALDDPGRLDVLATAPDGVIEAIVDPGHDFRLGVQWHPERTDDPAVGAEVFRDLVAAADRFRAG